MKQKIVFRADGNSSIGLGHVLRLIALADMLKADFTICFAVQEPTAYLRELVSASSPEIISLPLENNFLKEADFFAATHLTGNEIVVLDGYNFKSDYQKIIKSNCAKLVYVDDLHTWHHFADVIINHAEQVTVSDYAAEPQTRFYLGLKYALLRKEFFQTQNVKRNIPAVSSVFVSMGGADVHNVTLKIMEALAPLQSLKNIILLVGKVNIHQAQIEAFLKEQPGIKFQLKSNLSAQELYEELSLCQLAICPASTTALEACAVGVGMLSGFTADNQKDILNGLELTGCLVNLGDLRLVSVEQIRAAVLDLIENTDPLVKMMLAQNGLIDGKSPQRFLQIFNDFANA